MEPNAGGRTPHVVLVAEDTPDARALLADVLRGNGYAVLQAADEVGALAVAERSRPRLILLDMRMPVMDASQFAEAYRKLPGPHAPLLIMTTAQDAAAWAADVQGIACVAKPFDVEELLRLVRSLLGTGSAHRAVDGLDADARASTDDAEVSPLIGQLALLLLERQELVTRLTASEREPKPLVDRLERKKTRTEALLTQIGALLPPQDGL